MKALRIIAFIMMVAMTLTAFPLSVAAADGTIEIQYTPIVVPDGVAQGGTAELAPIVISFEGQENFEKNAMFKTFGNNEHGVYSFVTLADGTECLKLSYNQNQWWENYRAMVTFKDVDAISSAYKYARITYMTNDTEAAFLRLTNNANHDDNAVFAANASVSGGKWITSAPALVGGGGMLDRLAQGPALHCTIEYSAKSENGAMYIKELAFFTSEEQAFEYYGDGTKNDEPEPSEAPENLPEPIIMSFEGDGKFSANSIFKTFGNNEHGIYEFVTLADGTECLKLGYNKHKDWANYRVMATFKKAGTITEEYKYARLTYMTEDTVPSAIRYTNNANHADTAVFVADASVSKGQWRISNATYIAAGDMVKRLTRGEALHCTIEYDSPTGSSALYIKELAFFATEEQAYEYYGDSYSSEGDSVVYSALTFGNTGNGSVNNSSAVFGTNSISSETGAVDIVYGQGNFYNIKYMAKLRFNEKGGIRAQENYVRVLYSAENPEGVTGVSLFILNDGDKELIELQKNVQNTDGKFVLSDTVYFPDNIISRLGGSNPLHISFCSTANKPGGKYSIKAVYFFPSRAAADAFEYSEKGETKITIDGNDISDYRIVVPVDQDRFITAAVTKLVDNVKLLTGVTLAVVTDDQAVTAHEILVGNCDRPESAAIYEKAAADKGDNVRYEIAVVNGKLVLNAVETLAVRDAADMLVDSFLYRNGIAPEEVNLTSAYNFGGGGDVIVRMTAWDEIENVDAPTVITDDFSKDNKYYTEDGGTDNTAVANGVLIFTAKEPSYTYVHVYESNVRYEAKLKYSAASADSGFGLALRVTVPEAYVKGGYDKASDEVYIEYREGLDFLPSRVAAKAYTLNPDTWYDLALTTDGRTATLEVNGETLLTADGIAHVTPGRPAIFADNATVTVDEFKLSLLSGEGTVLRGVEHTKLPGDAYREGGTVIEMSDGTLHYETHHDQATFRSVDGGKTWVEAEPYFKLDTYPQIIRLNNGDLLNIVVAKVDGKQVRRALLSSDDGMTWREGGVVCPHNYNGVNSLNMNDKVTQSATTGRIFYSQNYDGRWTVNGVELRVFCVFFYSDDNGMTWHESETGSWEIEGNEKQQWFGESKIIGCADGTLRMYNSWNRYPCIVYSESTDNGVTWGPIQQMPEFVCTTSSMQIVRDPYADNDTTYYMVWVNCDIARSRLSLAKSTDGKNWSYLGDLWRWECAYKNIGGLPVAHIVDPFVSVSKDKIIAGSGIVEFIPETGAVTNGHGELRQHIWSIDRDTLGEGKPTNKFLDMDMGAPYYEAVTYVSSEGLFQGTSAADFSPNTAMTRSMFVTVLGRMDGADMSVYTKPTFNDVVPGQWYTTYVEWAAANKIVNGLGDGNYGVNNHVTVQQACTVLYRYADGKPSTVGDDALGVPSVSDFSDASNVSSWAADGVKWAVENGVYTGMNGKLNPDAPASRAVVAEMLYNYVNNIG